MGHGGGMRTLLTSNGIEIEPVRESAANEDSDSFKIQFVSVNDGSSNGPAAADAKPRKKKGKRAKNGARKQKGTRPRSRKPKTSSQGLSPQGSGDKVQALATDWQPGTEVAAQTNYFLGNEPSKWRTGVSNYSDVIAPQIVSGVDLVAYGNASQMEYDLRFAPAADDRAVRLRITGASGWSMTSDGDVVTRRGSTELRMKRPSAYQQFAAEASEGADAVALRQPIDVRYDLHDDGTIGFAVGSRDPRATLVIDPVLTLTYFSFLGGAGADSASSVVVDSMGNLYVGGTTTSVRTFAGGTSSFGPGAGASDFFVAKFAPISGGGFSLAYLDFIGGSAAESGGKIAVDGAGDVVIAGTTSSADYPVTGGSSSTSVVPTASVNDVAITELNPAGSAMLFSTLFGGSGNEATQSTGGVAFSTGTVAYPGDIYVAMDTQSSNLPITPAVTTNSDGSTTGAFQGTYGGGVSDGFLAIFDPSATATSHLVYCTYLGIDAQATVTGLAVDAKGNAYLSGYTSDDLQTFPVKNAIATPAQTVSQSSFSGGAFDGFVLKLSPSGMGAADLSYATFLGGSVFDQALGIAIGTELPGTVYVTGTTQSPDFPVNGSIAAFQPTLGEMAQANAFFSVITQSSTGATSLQYSTYLGGTQSDSGRAIAFAGTNQIFLAGDTTSFDFPWLYNLQPFNGTSAAWLAELDPTSVGKASLLYATPLGGTTNSGGAVTANGNGIAADATGNAYIAGDTNASDFPRTTNLGNGFQLACASCTLTPAASDAFVAEISVNTAAAATVATVAFNAASVNFGTQIVGAQNNEPQPVAVWNRGDAPLGIQSIQTAGPNAADFFVTTTGNCLTSAIAPGSECSLEVGFTPSVHGPETAFLSFTDSGAGSPQELALVGSGSGPFAMLSPLAVMFANQVVGAKSPPIQQVTLTNTGNETLDISNVAISGANPSAFSASGCSSTNIPTLNAGASCAISITFLPESVGTFQAELIVTDNSGDVSGSTQTVPLSGSGTNGAPNAVVTPLTISFGSYPVGSVAPAQIVTLTNTGTVALEISQITLGSANAAEFAVATPSQNACPINGGSLAAAANCNIAITFSPRASGAFAATLVVADNAAGSPQIVTLQGTGASASASVTPTSVSFSTGTVGVASAPATITLANTGTTTMSVNTIQIVGANVADFVATPTCAPSLAAGTNCKVSVVFNPTAAGNRSASLQITDSAAQSPQTVALSGVGVQAAASIAPTSISFGNQIAGVASAPAMVTVSNTGSAPAVVSVNSAAVTGSTDFAVKNNCPQSIAAGASCTLSVTFNPALPVPPGARTGTLSITDNVSTAPISIPLSGTAVDFELGSQTVGGTSTTVAGGQTATFTLDVTSVGAFTGPVTFTCTGTTLPETCTVPAPLAVAANAQTVFQVTVATSATSKRVPASSTSSSAWPRAFRTKSCAALIALFAGLVMFAFALAGNVKARRRAVHFAASAALFVTFAVMLGACGGSSASAPDPPDPTTYSLTVTGTANGATRTVPLTLVVTQQAQ